MKPVLYQYSVRASTQGEILSAINGEHEAASVCLQPTGEITPIQAVSVDSASALLRQCIRYATKQSLTALTLCTAGTADELWNQAAKAAGFHPCSSPVQVSSELELAPLDQQNTDTLRYTLPPNREHNATSSPLIKAEGQQQIIEQTDRLLSSADKFIDILSDDLEPWLYNRPEVVDYCLALLNRSNRSRVRVLIRDSENLFSQHHRIVQAHLRANERLQLKKVGLSAQEQAPQMLLIDDTGLLLRQQRQSLQAVVYDQYRQRHKLLREQFEQLWARASSLPELASQQW